MSQTQAEEVAPAAELPEGDLQESLRALRQILQQQAHIAQTNHASLQKLFEIVVEQSRQIDSLVGAVGELLEALENRYQ